MKSLFEQFGGTYRKENDYEIPNLRMPETEELEIGLYGQRHLEFLQQYRRVAYINLLTSGRLNQYLTEIDRQAQERTEQMKQAQGISEQLKVDKPMEWVQRMNNIRACAMEIVNEEIIYA